MEIKKSSKADLEKNKSLNLLMGMVIALAILFVSFEWGEREIKVATSDGTGVVIDEEEIEATFQNEPPPPPPPPQEIPQEPEVIDVVDDDKQVDDLNITSTEDDAGKAQQAVYVPPTIIEQPEEEIPDDFVWENVEKMPQFPGGDVALQKWLYDNLVYPTIAAENGIQGRVSCQFTVNTDGTVVDIEIVRGRDPSLDKEAMRVLKKLPNFIPGEQRGKKVRVKFNLPVTFRLQNSN